LTIQFLCILWKLKMVFHFDFSGMSFQWLGKIWALFWVFIQDALLILSM
jgi:hypothetical protein